MVRWRAVLAAALCAGFAACTALEDATIRPRELAGANAGEGGLAGAPAAGESGEASLAGSAAGTVTDVTGVGGMAGAWSDEPEPDAPCPDLKPTTGVTYYACACGPGADPDCEAGIEDAAGTDPARPLRSLESLRQRFSLLQDGDAVAFCRGGSFKVENDESWLNEDCGAGRCSIRDYTPPWASGDESPPRIDAAGYDGLSLKASHVQVLNLALSGGKRGVRIADGDSAFLCGLTLAAFDVGVLLEDSGRNRIEQSAFTNIAGPAIAQVGNTSEFDAIIDNHFASVALDLTTVERLAQTGAIDVQGASKKLIIQGNDFRRVGPDEEFGCSAYAIAIHGDHDHPVISDNRVEGGEGKVAAECGGILLNSSASDSPVTSSAALVRKNRLHNLGNIFISARSCIDCVFENNLLVQETNAGGTNAFSFTGVSSGLRLINNTVYFSSSADASVSAGVAIFSEDEQEYPDWIWSNNLIVVSGIADLFTCFSAHGAWESALWISDNNACHAPLAVTKQWMPTYTTLSSWQEAMHHDISSVAVEPGLIEAGGDDFLRPRAPDSLLIGKGSAIHGSDEDLDGAQRHSPPDIGAREHRDSP